MAPDASNGIADGFSSGERKAAQEAPLPRAVSDISAELNRKALPEVEQARCECCELSEECTPTYISRVRELFCGRWICGLCAEAVKEERLRMGGEVSTEDALIAHITLCEKFIKIARSNPALYMADSLRELLKKRNGLRSKSVSIARSSSCIPAFTREGNSLP